MSAAGLKDFAVGLAVLIVTAGVVYVVFKGAQAVKSVAAAAKGAAAAAQTGLNPANPQNYVNRAFTAAGSAVTGDTDFSLGSYIYDWFNPAKPPVPLPPKAVPPPVNRPAPVVTLPPPPDEPQPWFFGGGSPSQFPT